GARVLDVPCGSGRHSLELAKRGYAVTGIDLSRESLDIARGLNTAIDWREGDMRRLELGGEAYDGAFCFGNSFAFLDPAAAGAFLGAVAHALKPGAKLALDAPCVAESILPALVRSRWFRAGDIFMLSENRYVPEESRLDIDYTFIRGAM